MSNQPEAETAGTVIRRRPTRRHCRNRAIRRVLLAVFCAGLVCGLTSIALQRLSPSLFRSSNSSESGSRGNEANRALLLTQQESLRQIENRPAYPYSVVSGGVRDVQELKWAAEHDPVVASHYAGFDYDHARVVRLVLARTAYISYRIGNKVYWTRHRVSLKKGETLITDGKITARSRCGNRVGGSAAGDLLVGTSGNKVRRAFTTVYGHSGRYSSDPVRVRTQPPWGTGIGTGVTFELG